MVRGAVWIDAQKTKGVRGMTVSSGHFDHENMSAVTHSHTPSSPQSPALILSVVFKRDIY